MHIFFFILFLLCNECMSTAELWAMTNFMGNVDKFEFKINQSYGDESRSLHIKLHIMRKLLSTTFLRFLQSKKTGIEKNVRNRLPWIPEPGIRIGLDSKHFQNRTALHPVPEHYAIVTRHTRANSISQPSLMQGFF